MHARRLFSVEGGASLTISQGLHLAHGFAEQGGGCINAKNGSVLLISGATLAHCSSSLYGGGICLDGNASMAMKNATITVGETSAFLSSPGLRNPRPPTPFSLSQHCTAAVGGGGAYLASNTTVLNMTDSSASRNMASDIGGFVFATDGAVIHINGSNITANVADAGTGGGIGLQNAAIAHISSSEATGNVAFGEVGVRARTTTRCVREPAHNPP